MALRPSAAGVAQALGSGVRLTLLSKRGVDAKTEVFESNFYRRDPYRGCKPKPPKIPSSGVLGFYRLVQSSLVDGQVSNDQKNSKALPLLKKISPVAWQNIHFHGHYTFCGSRHPINLDAMGANLMLEEGGQGLLALWIRSDSRNVMEIA